MAGNFTDRESGFVLSHLPGEIPVFPLPETVLFPHIDLPLYIFEPRYRKMLADCYRTNKLMAISLLKEGWEDSREPMPSCDVVGVGYIRVLIENEDGTSYIILKGVCRARIQRYVKLEPYRIAKLKVMPDRIENKDELQHLASRLRQLLLRKLRFQSETPQFKYELPAEYDDPLNLSYLATYMLNSDKKIKQDLFETTNSNCRIRHLIDLLEEEFYPPGSFN